MNVYVHLLDGAGGYTPLGTKTLTTFPERFTVITAVNSGVVTRYLITHAERYSPGTYLGTVDGVSVDLDGLVVAAVLPSDPPPPPPT